MTVSDIIRTHCTGCCACMNICAKNAIQITSDKEGFYVPQIKEDICVGCGKCYLECPGRKENRFEESLIGYLIRLKDSVCLKNSASGGAFVGIAGYMLKKYNALIVGAAIVDDLSVKHIIIDSMEQLKKLQNSKYVQSFIGNVYQEVLEALHVGRTVLFSGTPCQIAGLYAVVPKEKRERLYTMDLVCHGVPSPAFLKRQLEMDSKSKQGRIIDFYFRYKNPKAESNSYYMMIMMMMRGLPLVRRTAQDVYFNLFMKGMDFRESCYNCKYANLKRLGDFTIGDCDSKQFYKNFHPNESNSILLINTDKAKNMWDELSILFDYTELDVVREAQYNHQLNHPFIRTKQRDGIYEELLNDEWNVIKAKYATPQSKLDRYKLLILLNTPEWVRKVLIKLRRRIRG